MAKISHRERILLGYDPDSPTSFHSERSSEVDFSDVFGGPPRRFSIQESRNGSIDCAGGDGEEFRGSFLGFGEKPVFGNETGGRRKYPSEDFFDDIFKGDQSSPSCSQSPRIVPPRDSFSSGPGSRVMSPSRPLPPSAEPFLSPAKFSLPVRVTSTDFVASSSAPQSWNSPISYSSRFNQTTQNHDILHGDARLAYRPSPLSHQNSIDSNKSPKPVKLQDKPGLIKDSKHSAVLLDSTQFHFSIYKWANKGVPLIMPVRRRSRSKESIKITRCLGDTEMAGSDISVGVYQEVEIPDDQSLPFNSCNSTLLHSKSAESQTLDDIAQELSKFASNNSSLHSTEKQVQEDVDFHSLQDPKESQSFSEKGSFLREEIKANNPKSPAKTKKFNLKTLGSLFQEDKKDETLVAEKGGKERKVKDKEKPSLDDFVPSRKVNKVKADSFREVKDDPKKGEDTAGSKVKDFVKIFSQESSSKATKHVEGQSQSQRWKDSNRTYGIDNEVKPTPRHHDEEQASSINWETSPAEDSEMANGDSFLFGKQEFDVSSSARFSATPVQSLPNEPITNGVRNFASNIKNSAQDDILSKDLIQDIAVQVEVENKDETKSYENKIRQWSKGKEGNIRALLSTLQYVLWPNSGWKPVPLVDIIEANAVKRAYQRALLRLHPDKLQQKGAAAHEKFIAEKVFDVLQEAWDHFNSLGAL